MSTLVLLLFFSCSDAGVCEQRKVPFSSEPNALFTCQRGAAQSAMAQWQSEHEGQRIVGRYACVPADKLERQL